MKKAFLYITVFAASLAAASCSKNQPPVFDDANAFVAFDKTAVSMDEAIVKPSGEIVTQTATLKVPVTLASVKGISETVKFTVKAEEFQYKDYKDPEGDLTDKANWVNKTALPGVNFNLKTTSGTLTFDAAKRTQYIEFEVLYIDEYTGDMKFDIELSKPESVVLGYNKKCTVTIGDVNHPLTALLGEYEAKSSIDATTNPWQMILKKDATDDHMVWFWNIFGNNGWADDDTMYYGNVDEDLSTINVPFGQTCEYKYQGSPITLWSLTEDDEISKTGSVTIKILKDPNDDKKIVGLDFGEEYGFLPSIDKFSDPDPLTGGAYISWAYPQITAVKK